MKENYQRQLDALLQQLDSRPSLLLHSCCGPCSSYVLEYLSHYFTITVFYCNPCIAPEEEYLHRLEEQKRLLREMPFDPSVSLLSDPYDHDAFLQAVVGLEGEAEGGARCTVCFRQRMERTAQTAKIQGFDYFASTLTVSPHKNAERLNQIGRELETQYGVSYLVSDFKKKEGYKRSILLSRQYELYRQEYCGCEFSASSPRF